MSVRRQRAITQQTYAMEKDKKVVILKGKFIHRYDKEFSIVKVMDYYSSVNAFETNLYYKEESNIEHWKFDNGRWNVEGNCK